MNLPLKARPLPLAQTGLAKALSDESLAARVVMDINPRARRISLRVDPVNSRIVLVRPPRASDRSIMTFMADKSEWIAAHLETLQPPIAFVHGAVVPYRGVDHVICLRPQSRGGVWREHHEIIVTGRPEHAARRLRDWLKAEARSALNATVYAMAATLGLSVARITVRDTRSRWGSCSRDGKLAFSWRLIMAPESVLTYVSAHEVAHLKHMNHGPAFWRVVESLLEESPLKGAPLERDWASAREWLRRGGAALHRYG